MLADGKSALLWYVNGFSARSGMQMRLEIDKRLGRFAPEIELAVFRVVQEALTNIHRHVQSKTGTIRLRRGKREVTLAIRDHGKGISADKLDEIRAGGGGIGLRGMRERVHQLLGEIRVDSDGSGTRLVVIFPVTSPRKQKPTPEIRLDGEFVSARNP